MFMNRIVFLFLAKRLAEQRGASPDQSLRDALPVLLVNPPMMGLFLAIALAQRERPPAPKLINANAQNAGNAVVGPQGNQIYDQLLKQVGLQDMEIPNLVGASKARANRILTAMGLNAEFVYEGSEQRDADDRAVVVSQRPAAWSRWKPSLQEVTLKMGWVDHKQ